MPGLAQGEEGADLVAWQTGACRMPAHQLLLLIPPRCAPAHSQPLSRAGWPLPTPASARVRRSLRGAAQAQAREEAARHGDSASGPALHDVCDDAQKPDHVLQL